MLYVHGEKGPNVVFEEGREQDAYAQMKDGKQRMSQQLAFFKLCRDDPEARQYTFIELPRYYWWDKSVKEWKKRVYVKTADQLLVSLGPVNPKNRNLTAIRMLLQVVKGPTCIEDLRRVNGEVCLYR